MHDNDWIEPAVRLSAADHIRTELIRAIREGRLAVGAKLPSEGELAQRFGVSRPVIREALVSLRVLGLTTAQNGRGTFVVSSDIKLPLILGDVSSEDLNEVRLCLEVPAAEMAASRRTDADLDELRAAVDLYAKATQPADRVREDIRFHLGVTMASKNELLHRFAAELRPALQEQSLALAAVSGRRDQATQEHRDILDAIVEGDSAAAADAMRGHLMGVHCAVAQLK